MGNRNLSADELEAAAEQAARKLADRPYGGGPEKDTLTRTTLYMGKKQMQILAVAAFHNKQKGNGEPTTASEIIRLAVDDYIKRKKLGSE